MQSYPLISFGILFLLLATVTNCGIKPTSGGKRSALYETFYSGTDGGTQYYIKPLVYIGADNEQLLLDITFRDGNFKADSARLNYTVITPAQLSTVELLTARSSDGNFSFTTDRVSRLFQERAKNGIQTRFTGLVSNKELLKAMISSSAFFVGDPESKRKFEPTAKTNRQLAELRVELFSFYEKEL